MQISSVESKCKELKTSIDYVNVEIGKLEGARKTYEDSLASLDDKCKELGVDSNNLDAVLEQGEAKLEELVEEAQKYIDAIKELKCS